jgi:hypothetical protein
MPQDALCIFCLRPRSDPTPWVPGNPGQGCQYGLAHEYPEEPLSRPAQVRIRPSKLCAKCGLHPKNPASMTNGCEHEWPEGIES